MMQSLPGVLGPVMGCVFIAIWIGAIAGYVVFLIAVWRLMKAHESIAESMLGIASRGHAEGPR